MPRDLEGLADIVVLTVKNAMAPALERIALLEKENGDLRQRLDVVTELRDRVVVVETKAAMPAPSAVLDAVEPVDLGPILARVSVLEQAYTETKSALAVVPELRDRVVIVETKAALPLPIPATSEVPPVDIAPLLERLAALEQSQADTKATLAAVPELRDRVVVVETKAAMPLPMPVPPVVIDKEWVAKWEAQNERISEADLKLKEVANRLDEATDGFSAAFIEMLIRNRIDPVTADVTAVRERVIALEARAPVPGPPGKDGLDGKDGAPGTPGRDGADGLGFDDMDVEFDDRTLTLKFERGSQKRVWPITLPYLQYEGVYIDGKAYERGSVVTWAGSTWHANEQTNTKPGEGSKAWTLIVKRGRDGKDGRDALDPMPVVSVKR
jgi:hypothetical protein